MKLTIINGTNRPGNNSQEVTDAVFNTAKNKKVEVEKVNINSFATLFQKYLSEDDLNSEQKNIISKMTWADVVYFVTPTYHHSIPGSLKNFLDVIAISKAFENKIFGLIGSSSTVDGVRALEIVLSAILAYNNNASFILPKQLVCHHANIDESKIADFIEYTQKFAAKFK